MAEHRAARDRIALELRAAAPGVRAALIGHLRDFDLAEDALQDALLRAWERWPRAGVPERPDAWLYRVGVRRAVDRRRHERIVAGAGHSEPDEHESRDPELVELVERGPFDDDLLRLIFTCCHPALRPDARAALTLRTVLDLGLDEVARAFLVDARTMEQRLVRAKRRIRESGLEWSVPSGAELSGRLDDVLRVAYLIFTEGYSATAGDTLTRPDLCALAIGLTRQLNRLLRGQAEALALLALMLLQDARSNGRTDAAGQLVLLEDQDRSTWNRGRIREGTVLLEKALQLHQRPGPYQIQASIAALHATAPSARETDWPQIAGLYDALCRVSDTPVVRLNRAVALAMCRGAAAGLAELDRLRGIPALEGHHPYHVARGALLARLGQIDAARDSYRCALGLARNEAERGFIRERIARLAPAAETPRSC